MGKFQVTVVAIGGHGCQRQKGDGEVVEHCGDPHCPDCIARNFVAQLKASGNASIETATLEHWPGEPYHVVDDLLSGVRHGSFTYPPPTVAAEPATPAPAEPETPEPGSAQP